MKQINEMNKQSVLNFKLNPKIFKYVFSITVTFATIIKNTYKKREKKRYCEKNC